MDFELISVLVTIVAVGITSAGLLLATVRGLRREMRQEMRDIRGHMGRIDSHIAELREGMARVEGLLKGLRDSLARRIITDINGDIRDEKPVGRPRFRKVIRVDESSVGSHV